MKHRTLEELALLEDIKELKIKYHDLIKEYVQLVNISRVNGDTVSEIGNLMRINTLWTVIFDFYKIIGNDLWN